MIEEVGWWIGFGLANLACVLDPQCFVLGGGVVQAGDLLVESARASFGSLVEGRERRPLAVVVRAEFGERAGAVGAALAARRRARLTTSDASTSRVPLRTGVVLPTFRETPQAAFEAAAEAVSAGVDGLFCYDHIWPLGQPERPALAPFPILGALATRFGAAPGRPPFLGTLVARIGLVPNAVLAAQFSALEQLAPRRRRGRARDGGPLQ